ncbi:MAG: DNA-binding protein [Pseudomonadota bacterium]|nr:DNA-binding protein [Pseudomonadota bacterium]
MRDYGVVSPQFWIGQTGKALRGNAPAQLLALYLMTCPHSNMIGVFHCPVLYMAHETGLGMEGATKALHSLIEADFCVYEGDTDTVFVKRMASYQIAESLKPGDNRVLGVKREYAKLPEGPLKQGFYATYSVAFILDAEPKKKAGTEAPPKPLASQEQEQEQEQEQDLEPKGSLSPAKLPTCPHETLIDLFAEHLPALPQPKKELWAGKNAEAMRARWRWVLTAKKKDGTPYASTSEQAVAWFARFFGYVEKSDFLSGRSGKWTGCDLGWLMKADNFAKVVQGNYEQKTTEGTA